MTGPAGKDSHDNIFCACAACHRAVEPLSVAWLARSTHLPYRTIEARRYRVAGEGHWITGTAMIIAAYLGSLLVVERIFRIVKPKLLILP
jgi:hypothetical protein